MTQATPTPKTMKAAVLTDLNSLEVRHIPVPRPRSGEALVKIIACGVCHTDLHVMRGEVAFPTPAVLGHEISGTVVEFGPNTDPGDLQVGTDVVGAFIMPCTTCAECQSGRDDLCANFFAQDHCVRSLPHRSTRHARRGRLSHPGCFGSRNQRNRSGIWPQHRSR